MLDAKIQKRWISSSSFIVAVAVAVAVVVAVAAPAAAAAVVVVDVDVDVVVVVVVVVVVAVVGRFSHTHLATSVPLFRSKVTTNSWERSCDWMAG